MIIIPIALGLYVIGVFGYKKIINKVIDKSPGLQEVEVSNPVLFGSIILAMTAAWPVSIYITLVMEAVKNGNRNSPA